MQLDSASRARSQPLAAGVIMGIAYTLSPLTVWCLLTFAFLIWPIGHGSCLEDERTASPVDPVVVLARLAVIVAPGCHRSLRRALRKFFWRRRILHPPRATWARNVALGIPIHSAD